MPGLEAWSVTDVKTLCLCMYIYKVPPQTTESKLKHTVKAT